MLIFGLALAAFSLFLFIKGREMAMDFGPGFFAFWLIGSSILSGLGGALVMLSLLHG